MEYPSFLKPTSTQAFALSTGETISVAKTSPRFLRWAGENFQNTYGGKAVVDMEGVPFFAELAILRTFQKDGWTGVWVDTYSGRFRTIWEGAGVEIPAEKQLLIDEIKSAGNLKSGCWDVFCWRNDEIVFAEAKRLHNDQIRSTQVNWLEASVKCGIDPSSFLLVEWSF